MLLPFRDLDNIQLLIRSYLLLKQKYPTPFLICTNLCDFGIFIVTLNLVHCLIVYIYLFIVKMLLALWYASSNSANPDKIYTSRLISPLTNFSTHQCLNFYYTKRSSSLIVAIQLLNGTEIVVFRDERIVFFPLWTKTSINVPRYEEVSNNSERHYTYNVNTFYTLQILLSSQNCNFQNILIFLYLI